MNRQNVKFSGRVDLSIATAALAFAILTRAQRHNETPLNSAYSAVMFGSYIGYLNESAAELGWRSFAIDGPVIYAFCGATPGQNGSPIDECYNCLARWVRKL